MINKRFMYENSKDSIEWCFWIYKAKIQNPKKNVREYRYASVVNYRRSKAEGYKYISLEICYYFNLCIRLHKPI